MATAILVLADSYEILNIFHPRRWGHRSEAKNITTKKIVPEGKGKGKASDTEAVMDHVRYDLIFYAVDNRGRPRETIAILEYKKPNMIRHSDFKDALVSKDALPGEVWRTKRKAGLKQNALMYSKQLSVYASTQSCQHVALFNWDNLLLFTSNVDDDSEDFTAGDEADLIWISETGSDSQGVNMCPIRQAMLGWLLRAFRDPFSQ
ncbi:hypothetical protein IQ06DRAFT_292998 [Phaeosphaeriaceae sp. SRC1lsM3a]|nr:hypothetical protein IQ06DRAFT_292998 [Stagonospora sp. SRC1lsM3a]